MKDKYDFSGWATKNNLRCSDGRTILKDAFKENDGTIVPLVWQHNHSDPTNILGHALLENRPEGVYAYGVFNDTDMGQHAKLLVEHGDIKSLSIYANQLKQHGGDVLHGKIREVSLVLAGANPGASIEFPILEHGEESETEAVIYVDDILEHNDSGEEIDMDETQNDEGDKDMNKNEELEHKESTKSEETIGDVFETLSDKQKDAVYAMIGAALEEAGAVDDEDDENDEDIEHSDYEEGTNFMKYNVFDTETEPTNVLSHEDMDTILKDAKRLGSLKESVLQHAEDEWGVDYGTEGADYAMNNMDFLFPEYKSLNNTPEFIKRDTDWVTVVMNGVHHTPFSRIKSLFADITADEARAKGYIKGRLKKEEVFSLLKRTTDPQTVYKKQKFDRDDVVDITDFDVIAWVKGEMRMMLDEELARAFLIGDGRLPSDDDKISPDHIRPVATDSDLFSIKVTVDPTDAKDMIDKVIRSRKDYKGSGNPIMFTTEDVLTEMLLLEDGIQHKLYKTESELATALRVSRIVTVPVMENTDYAGVILNLNDYNVGADKGGAVNMFDDFDIDYNQMKYLIETRCSGALVKPYSAIVLKKQGGSNSSPTPSVGD